MRALLCEGWNGYQALVSKDVDAPALRPGTVRIAVRYATAGFGVTLVVAGKYQRKPPLPFVPGTEISGVVTEVAGDVTHLRPGDRVAAIIDWGGYADEAVAAVENVWPVPDEVSLATACCVPATYGTAYASLHWRARLRAGETVLVFGAAGGVGLPAVEIAHLAGARVFAVARTEERLQIARSRGADQAFVTDTPDLGRVLKDAAGGRGVEVVFDPVGGACFQEALRCAAPEGRVLVIGFASGEIPQIPANILLVKNIEVIGVNMGLYSGWTPVDERVMHAPRMAQMMQTLFDHVRAGRLLPQPATIFPLAQFREAFDTVIGRRSVGRVVLSIGEDR